MQVFQMLAQILPLVTHPLFRHGEDQRLVESDSSSMLEQVMLVMALVCMPMVVMQRQTDVIVFSIEPVMTLIAQLDTARLLHYARRTTG